MLLPALLATLFLGTAEAVTLEIPVQGSRELTLAIPKPQTPSGEAGAAGTIAETVRRDLDLTGYFRLLDPNATTDPGGVEPGSFDFASWRGVKASALAKLRVLPGGSGGCDAPAGQVCADVYVYDVLGSEKIAGKRITASADQARAIGHKVASEILMALVGEPGFFDGHLIAVGTRGSENKEVYLLDVDGQNVRPVTRNGSINLSPAWSPDGNNVAFTSYKRGNPDVYVKEMRGGAVRTISSRSGVNLSPAFSPDGDTLAIARSLGEDTDIWLVDARTGRDIRRLTTGGGIDVAPCFTPDGRTVVFSSERGGGTSIYAVSTQGGTPWRVTPFSGRFTDPMVSPDGKRVAFVVQHGAFDVWVANLDGTGLVKITEGMGDNEDPSWSPDGNYLAFSSTRRGRQEIWLSTANGRHQVPLTDTGGWSQPMWRPRR